MRRGVAGLIPPAWSVLRLAALALALLAPFPPTLHADVALPRPAAMPPLFGRGARCWSVTAGASRDATLGNIYFTQLNADYYLADNLAIRYGGMVGYADAKRTRSGALGGPEVGLRWHFAQHQRWSTYLEALVGAVLQQYPLADHTLRFNFDLQPGCGVTYRSSTTLLYEGGFRWHHLSNAQVRGRAHNFGYDGPTLYIGLMRSF